ncbi:MAG: domain containing protein [Firmicutes bacterium]|nr:domain containing protein [Bacillota bacterium]
MKFVRNIESFFEKHIEGFFDKKLSAELQPVEIAKNLARIMEQEKTIGVSCIYVPNEYCIYLHADDFDRMSSYHQTISQDLAVFLFDEAKKKGYVLTGPPVVQIKLSDENSRNRFRCLASFSEPLLFPDDAAAIVKNDDNPSTTRVFNKVNAQVQKPVPSITGSLTVIEGGDIGLKVAVGTGRIHIGRRESNELPLTDMNTSRIHAYVVFDENAHVLHDANSLNGTYVNNHRVTFIELKSNDRIRIGNTIIVYEVN